MRERPCGDEPNPTAGEATLDLSRRRRPPTDPDHPAVAEARIRSRSRHLILAGGVLTGVIFASTVVWHAGFGSFMPAAYTIPLYAASCGAILLGCMEYITRHTREQSARTYQVVLQVQADQLRLVDLLDEELKQRYYRGAGDMAADQRDAELRTGTGPAVGRAPANRSGGEVVNLRRPRNDSLF